ncbi:MAG: hypothetical protein KDD92_18615 [Caldilineaceae bacterium]|nr:hypothetical protein [Caldilineaceae bacterium]
MQHPPKSVLTTLVLLVINVVFWLIFALIMALGGVRPLANAGAIRWIMAGLAFGASVALGATVVFLRRRNRLAFYFGVLLLSVIAVLSATDEFGPLDLFTFLISFIPLGLMAKDRFWYLHQAESL